MSYTTNPHLPRLRMQAVLLTRQGWSTRAVARHFGFNQSTIVRWVKRAPVDGRENVPTRSSRPHHHPRTIARDIVMAIREKRLAHHRCAEVVHREVQNNGFVVSLSTVKRTLQREGLIRRRGPKKRWHQSGERPKAIKPGSLVQLDTIHIQPRGRQRFYVYTLIDVYSRWAFAAVSLRANSPRSLGFLRAAQARAPFTFQMLQSDHGSEFSTHFSDRAAVTHRHSRVRQPNDNGHLERFNRTLQDECFRTVPEDPKEYQRALKRYLPYYNGQRLHLGLNLKTPLEVMPSY